MAISYIYIIGPALGGQKIGYSKHPEKRLKQLQTGHPEELLLHHVVGCDSSRVRLLERVIHFENGHKKKKGEWFDFSPSEAIDIVNYFIIRYADDETLKYKFP